MLPFDVRVHPPQMRLHGRWRQEQETVGRGQCNDLVPGRDANRMPQRCRNVEPTLWSHGDPEDIAHHAIVAPQI
jgi:hypothetical protein